MIVHTPGPDRTLYRCPGFRFARVLITLSLLPSMAACYVHHAYDPQQQAPPIPHGEVRVLTLRGEVFMLRSIALSGDTLTGERVFCRSGWGYDEQWCKGIRGFPADSSRIAIAMRDIQHAQTRSLSAVRTVVVAVGITGGLALVTLLILGISQTVPAY